MTKNDNKLRLIMLLQAWESIEGYFKYNDSANWLSHSRPNTAGQCVVVIDITIPLDRIQQRMLNQFGRNVKYFTSGAELEPVRRRLGIGDIKAITPQKIQDAENRREEKKRALQMASRPKRAKRKRWKLYDY